jgi:hypothetical protein
MKAAIVLLLGAGLWASIPRAGADEINDSFQALDKTRWRAVNIIGDRKLPGLEVEAKGGVLRIAGITSGGSALDVGGVRTIQGFSASPDQPFTVEVTRAFHGGRALAGEVSIMLWQSMDQFVQVRESLDTVVKDGNYYQPWQIVHPGQGGLASGIQFTDIADQDDFLKEHPQPVLDCRINEAPRRLQLIHDGKRVTVFLDGRECGAVEVPWSDQFVVCLVAGSWRDGVAVEAGFRELKINGRTAPVADPLPIDALWEKSEPAYWKGDKELRPDAVKGILTRGKPTQLAMVARSGWPTLMVKACIDWSVEQSLDCVAIDIPWRDVERSKGNFDFAKFDGIINYAVNRGLFVQIKPWWTLRSYPNWVSPELEQTTITEGGKVRRLELTFANAELNSRIARFIGAVAEHYKGYPVTCYTPVGTIACELEYSYADYRDGSRWAVAQFREWLRERYKTLDALNTAWGVTYDSWDSVVPPVDMPAATEKPDLRRKARDWFLYREWSIKQLVDRMAEAIKKADPSAVLAIQMGRILDGPMCPKRGTVGAFYWGESADMFISDPQPKDGDVMGYIIDYIRPSGKKAGMELDAPSRFEIPLDNYTANTLDCWRHGGIWASWANWTLEETKQPEVLKLTRDSTQAPPPPPVAPSATALFVSKWDLYCYHDGTRWREYREFYRDLTDGGRGIIDVLTDDVLLANPKILDLYSRIEVPYGDCLDRRIHQMLSSQKDKVHLHRPESFGKNLLDVSH